LARAFPLGAFAIAAACGDSSGRSHGDVFDAGGGDDGASLADGGPSLDAHANGDAGEFPPGLGAHFDGAGQSIRFRIYSHAATRIELSLFVNAMNEDARLRVVLAKDP